MQRLVLQGDWRNEEGGWRLFQGLWILCLQYFKLFLCAYSFFLLYHSSTLIGLSLSAARLGGVFSQILRSYLYLWGLRCIRRCLASSATTRYDWLLCLLVCRTRLSFVTGVRGVLSSFSWSSFLARLVCTTTIFMSCRLTRVRECFCIAMMICSLKIWIDSFLLGNLFVLLKSHWGVCRQDAHILNVEGNSSTFHP